jgi:hypothetical protein
MHVNRYFLLLIATCGVACHRGPSPTEALDALRGLKSVTEAGLNFPEYSSRVLDAKVKVDRYMDIAKADDPLRAKIATTMRIHTIAVSVWEFKIRNERDRKDAELVLGDSAISGIPPMASRIKHAMEAVENLPRDDRGKVFSDLSAVDFLGIDLTQYGPQLLWQCADVTLAEAIQLAK